MGRLRGGQSWGLQETEKVAGEAGRCPRVRLCWPLGCGVRLDSILRTAGSLAGSGVELDGEQIPGAQDWKTPGGESITVTLQEGRDVLVR